MKNNSNWLVVSTILKTISQWEGLSHTLWKIKKLFETTNQTSVLVTIIRPNCCHILLLIILINGTHWDLKMDGFNTQSF